MAQQLQAVRGTKDIYPADYQKYRLVTDTAEHISRLYGFEAMQTPVLEFTEVFKRTLGETSDVVGKEMYVFEDRGGESLCLRPEFTAGIVRSFIQAGLAQHVPFRLYTTGPLFRYERPQKGRQRQFHQVNFEILGEAEPLADIELIAMGAHLLKSLGVDHLVTLEINSLADKASRMAYKDALVTYLQDYKQKLSPDSQTRLDKNPMRILDSKDEGDKAIIAKAPRLESFYNEESIQFFEQVKQGLKTLDITFQVNPHLVRGLDYYGHTAFEFTTDALGSQNAVLAGGRYNDLIAAMGGPQVPAVGFAGGIERLVALLDVANIEAKEEAPVAILPIGDKAEAEVIKIAHRLRQDNIACLIFPGSNIAKRMKKVDRKHIQTVIIFGDDELAKNVVKVKSMQTGDEREVAIDQLVDQLFF